MTTTTNSERDALAAAIQEALTRIHTCGDNAFNRGQELAGAAYRNAEGIIRRELGLDWKERVR